MTAVLREQASPEASVTRPSRGVRRSRFEKAAPYAYVAPFFVIFGIFGLFPLLYNFYIAFFDWNPIGDQTFIGFDNFTRLAGDPRFWNALVNTLGIWLLSTIPQLLLALGLAHLLNHARLRFANFFRMSMLIPYITSVAATTVVFAQLFDRDYGLINWVISWFGGDNVDFLQSRGGSWVVIATMVAWRWFGYNTLLYLAALQAIPRDMYEAADVDGASGRQQFFHLTIPALRPVIVFTIITATIGGLQVFTEPLLVNRATPLTCGATRQCQTLTLFLYEQGFGQYAFGYGAAIGVALFLLIILLAGFNYLVTRLMKGGD